MKLQYLGDVNDAFKWDLLHWVCTRAKPSYQHLTLVPMLTPDEPASKDGRIPHEKFDCQPHVRSFLESLRSAPRDLTRLSGLGELDPARRFEVEVFAPDRVLAAKVDRERYWDGLDIESLENALVFLDPDNGFEPEASRTDKHVLHSEVGALLARLGPRSSLVVYQHRPHRTWADVFAGFRAASDYAPFSLAVHTGQLAFVFLSKSAIEYQRNLAAAQAYVADHPKVELTRWTAADAAHSARSSPSRSGHIFLEAPPGNLVPMSEAPYASEERLQELLERCPSVLAGDQIDPSAPRRWLLVDREFGIPGESDGGDRWAVDHLFLDQDAIPTLVEVKRSSDSRIRREVVGQMLDYAANALLHWPGERLRTDFERNCAARGEDPSARIAELTGSPESEEDFWARVQDNLRAGRVRLVFVADVIPTELQRVVEFLNQQMETTEVLAVEIRQYLGEGGRILVPRVFGNSVTTRDRKQSAGSRAVPWTSNELLEQLRAHGDEALAEFASSLFRWAVERGSTLPGGRGAKNPSIYLEWATPEGPRRPFSLYLTSSGLELYTTFAELGSEFELGADVRRKYCAELTRITGQAVESDRSSKGIRLDRLTDPGAQAELLPLLAWALDAAKIVPN